MLQQALSFHQNGRLDDAERLYREILASEPGHAGALHLLGVIHLQRKNPQAAVDLIGRAIAIEPGNPVYFCNRGVAFQDLLRFEDALASYDRALALKPDDATALVNRGNTLRNLRRLDEALESHDRALAVNPRLPEAFNNRGAVLQDKHRFADAVTSYDRALSLRPDYADAHFNRGNALLSQERFESAYASYDRAYAIEPSRPLVFGLRLCSKMYGCDWRGLTEDFRALAAKIEAGENAAPPFTVIATPLSPALRKRNAEIYARGKCPPADAPPEFARGYGHGKIRLAYFSADFREHAIAFQTAGLFEHHDRGRFELTAFSLGEPADNAMRTRLRQSFDRWIDAGEMSDTEIVARARDLEIDIAVDLMGFTRDSRPGILAGRPAPVQVNYLGFPGTLGMKHMDYILADRIVIPAEDRDQYSERVAYLPDTYMPADSARAVAARTPSRSECGLPEHGFVFCSFNNSFKFTPQMFDIWMRLLQRTPGSVLWLPRNNDTSVRNLQREAQARGVDEHRLVFAPRVDKSEDHLARLRCADLFLDTLPYNAHSSACDALWAGVPVLTCLGDAFPGRVAASLLNAVGLPELAAPDLPAYETLALALAADKERLRQLKERLAANRSMQPLFDTARFARNIEAAYTAMWKRHEAGLPPEPIGGA